MPYASADLARMMRTAKPPAIRICQQRDSMGKPPVPESSCDGATGENHEQYDAAATHKHDTISNMMRGELVTFQSLFGGEPVLAKIVDPVDNGGMARVLLNNGDTLFVSWRNLTPVRKPSYELAYVEPRTGEPLSPNDVGEGPLMTENWPMWPRGMRPGDRRVHHRQDAKRGHGTCVPITPWYLR